MVMVNTTQYPNPPKSIVEYGTGSFCRLLYWWRTDQHGRPASESISEKEPCEHKPLTDNDLQESLLLHDQIVAGEVTAATVCPEKVLNRIAKKAALSCHPTARLWLQYMDMVTLLRQFIKAERTGNWALHLHLLQEMLPYCPAAGHNTYAKYVHIYLQQNCPVSRHNTLICMLHSTVCTMSSTVPIATGQDSPRT